MRFELEKEEIFGKWSEFFCGKLEAFLTARICTHSKKQRPKTEPARSCFEANRIEIFTKCVAKNFWQYEKGRHWRHCQ